MEDKLMKKVKKQGLFRQIIGLFSLLFVTPFSSASDGWVKFTVTIKNGGTCQVHSGYENKQVDLGTVYANELSTANHTAGEKDFDLWVEECGDLINETNKLKFVLMNTTNKPNLLAKGVLPNLETGANKDSVGVQLLTKQGNPVEIKYNASSSPTETLVLSSNGDTLGAEAVTGQKHAFKLPLKARFYAITDGKDDKAGDVRAEVIFAAFYE
ncbi:type 1 fimbrial protein [Haemophilus haemolyticus]|uniref:Type 1 fimbrial protein n=2 Tax=Pasteurellaceae TaxID=712 RepID=A0A852Q4N1_HAEHA|nr:type 1 fimbrial protein [Haemophilus haemolyticus]